MDKHQIIGKLPTTEGQLNPCAVVGKIRIEQSILPKAGHVRGQKRRLNNDDWTRRASLLSLRCPLDVQKFIIIIIIIIMFTLAQKHDQNQTVLHRHPHAPAP